jgi:tetratricopeptide (TPR) repeat protein
MRGDFDEARRRLAALEGDLSTVGPAARAHHSIESGRPLVSAAHPAGAVTPEARMAAKTLFLRAVTEACQAELDAVVVDALHMLAFVEIDPTAQLRWNREALAVSASSTQPSARRWEASLRNNIGCALHAAGRFEEALAEFKRAVELRAAGGDPAAHRVARWMVAWTLRALDRLQDALAIQLALELECKQAGAPDQYVFEELATIYRALGDMEAAARYAPQVRAAR